MQLIEKLHPGYILKKEFLDPMNISHEYFSSETGISEFNLKEILHCRENVSYSTAVKLSHFFGTPETYWLDMQNQYNQVMKVIMNTDIQET